MTKHVITKAQWEEIKVKYETGMYSTREIGRQYGVRDKRITDMARREGWTRAFAYPGSHVGKQKKIIDEANFPEDGVHWPNRHLHDDVPEQINPPIPEDKIKETVKNILDTKFGESSRTIETNTPECSSQIPHPYQESRETVAVYSERYEAIRLELTRRKNLAKENRLDEQTLIKMIDRVGALDTEGAIQELVTARMQVNADTLARTAELKSIRDRYMSLVCDFLGPDPGKAAAAAMLILSSRNDSIQGALKMIADLDKLITETERKAFDMDKPMPKVAPVNQKAVEVPFDTSKMSVESLSALVDLANQSKKEQQPKSLPLPPTFEDEED